MITRPVYANREMVKRALDIKETARVNDQVDRLLESSTGSIDGFLHRKFYPRIQTLVFQTGWDGWLNDNEIVSVDTLSHDGASVSASGYELDPIDGPPYNRITLATSSTVRTPFGSEVSLSALYGYTLDLQPIGGLVSSISSSVEALTVPNGALVGVGDLLLIGSEYLLVNGRTWVDSGQDLQTPLTVSAANTSVVVTDGSAFAVSEPVLLDTEQCWVTDIAGNTLIVKRAWDGTVLATHTASSVYVPRTLTVARGMVGSTAASHGSSTLVYRWLAPALVTQLCVAETLAAIQQEQSGYARVVGSGETAMEARGVGLLDLRDRALAAHGRKSRHRVV